MIFFVSSARTRGSHNVSSSWQRSVEYIVFRSMAAAGWQHSSVIPEGTLLGILIRFSTTIFVLAAPQVVHNSRFAEGSR
jgi:hypothetical protein